MPAPKGNKFAEGLTNSGRPPIYSNDEEGYEQFKAVCIDFFDTCIREDVKATITGLALHLGFSCRDTLYEYAKKEEFSDLTKRAMLTVENSYELSGGTFDIFALKNMGWKDKIEQEIKTDQTIVWHEEKTYEADDKAD